MTLVITGLIGIPLIKKEDNLAEIIWNSSIQNEIHLEDGDIFVITQKIVSKSEGRLVNLKEVRASQKAIDLSKHTNKDPRLIHLILQESNKILRSNSNHIIVEHKLGFICANAGIDHSNVESLDADSENWYLLLPENPDFSAKNIREKIIGVSHKNIGILIIDSHGRAWRNGVVGTTIGLAGLPALVDLRGKKDIYGYKLQNTQVAVADELAGTASLVMGQSSEMIPVVHVRGFPYSLRESSMTELIRPKDEDLFR